MIGEVYIQLSLLSLVDSRVSARNWRELGKVGASHLSTQCDKRHRPAIVNGCPDTISDHIAREEAFDCEVKD